MKKYPDKDPSEVLDYTEHFTDLLTQDTQLSAKTMSVSVYSPSGATNTTPLEILSSEIIADPSTGELDTVLFWLTGGTLGLVYLIKCEAQDDDTPARTFVRSALISIKAR